jgi:phage-related protein
VFKLLREFNITLEMPYSRKINNRLRELRILHGSDYYRILYCAVPDRQFLLLHGVKKKTNKLSPQDIKVAENRLERYLGLEK